MNEPPQPQGPDETQQPSLLETRPPRTERELAPASGPAPADQRLQADQRRARNERPERQQGRDRRRQPEPAGPAPPRQPRAVRGESGGEVSLKTIALIAFVFGVFLHGCVAWSFLDDDGLPSEDDRPAIVVTSTALPQATATVTVLPDRTTCDEIRGTEYRSEAERDFFRRNCITG